ncbi:PilW family protein [Rubrivivax gelatinosus]|uniref:PilW family protein n=1 Tax=Rubrivivax gelatinosus TaxID=28068 RepID=UPI0002EEFFB3|nr:PilW family protein [Rubrivivax gelatinosus]MBG6079696.1 type IV pilus assembly protein PilW [Rubrivivax gelatinosus]
MSEARRRGLREQRGLSIIEVMVGMVIALIISLAAAGSARTFTASQRQGIGSGGVAINLTTAMATLKDDASSAGLGFFGTRDSNNVSQFACHKMHLSYRATKLFDGTAFSPMLITHGTHNDQVDLVFASSIDGGADVLLSGTAGATSAQTQSLLTAAVDQLVMLIPGSAGSSSEPCLVRGVTSVTAATNDSPLTFAFANTNDYNKAAFTNTPAFTETNKDRIVVLGTLNWRRYRLDGTTLLYEQPITGTSSTLLRNVMSFRAQYGVATNATSNDLSWVDATNTWAAVSGTLVDRIRAVRFGVVVRNAQPERPRAGGSCEASASKPKDPFDPDTEVEPDVANWQCYHYRSETVVVPLRNFVW